MKKKIRDARLIKKLQAHELWVESIGRLGTQLVLDEENLECYVRDAHHWEQSYLTCCSMRSVLVSKADFYAADIHSCGFHNSIFRGVCFVKANVSYSGFGGCKFEHVDYKKAYFDSSNFSASTFESCHLGGASFMDCNLSRCVFKNCDFDGIYLDNACLSGCRFINIINVEKAVFLKIIVGSLEQPVMLEGADAIRWIKERVIVEE